MLIEALVGGKHRDLLAPHFSFEQLRPGNVVETDLFRQIAALRYEVYCLECRYLNPEDYPRQVEIDDYDERSAHAAARITELRQDICQQLSHRTSGGIRRGE